MTSSHRRRDLALAALLRELLAGAVVAALAVALPAVVRWRGGSLIEAGLWTAVAAPWALAPLWTPPLLRAARPAARRLPWLAAVAAASLLALALLDHRSPRLGGALATLAVAALALLVAAAPAAAGPARGTVRLVAHGVAVYACLAAAHVWGWVATLAGAGGAAALLLVPGLRARRVVAPPRSPGRTGPPIRLAATLLAALSAAGPAMAIALLPVALVDLAMGLDELAVLVGLGGGLGALAGVLAVDLGRPWLRQETLAVAARVVAGVALAACALPALGLDTSLAVYLTTVLAYAACGGLGGVAIGGVAIAGRRSGAEVTATVVGAVVAAALSGGVADALGWPLFFLVAAALTVLAAARHGARR